jgi:hypothetical protein
MKQIKIFTSDDKDILEVSINDWLKEMQYDIKVMHIQTNINYDRFFCSVLYDK